MSKLTDQDVIDMAQRCIEEITHLRARLAVAEPKADAYDAIRQILGHVRGNESQGYGEDLVWRLRKQIEEIRAVKSSNPEKNA